MSFTQHLFVGPFAEWLVPEGNAQGLPPTDEDGEPLFAGRLRCNAQPGEPPDVVKVGRKRYHHFCYVPARMPPKRATYFEGEPALPGVLDVTEVDRQAKIDWFASKFEGELRALEEFYRAKPTFRWGLVCWLFA